MSRLTVTEKEHWKSRIEKRINKAIEALEAKDAKLMPTIRTKAEAEAHKALGITKLHSRLEEIKAQRKALDEQEVETELAMHRHVLGDAYAREKHKYERQSEFSRALVRCREQIEQRLLNDSDFGREILKLNAEKEALLDTVWLATSSAQIRELWSRVSAVLGDDATELQQRILSQDANAAAD